jgi:hypothetical protein
MGLVDVALKKVQVLTLFVDLWFCGGPVERVLAALLNVDVARLLL